MARSMLGRLGQLVRANVPALMEGAEDPAAVIDQLIAELAATIPEAEAAVAQTLGNLRLLEHDRDETRATVEEWGRKAEAAAARAEALRATNPAEADRFEDLARVALTRQISYEGELDAFEGQVAQHAEVAEQLKGGLAQLRDKHADLVRRRDELVSRARMAEAQIAMRESAGSRADPTGELDRFEEHVRMQEARVQGMAEVDAITEGQALDLDVDPDDLEVQRRLDALKRRGTA